MTMKRLMKSNTDKMISGVLAGIGEHFDIDPTLVRIAYVLMSLFSACFPGLILYIVMMIIVPQKDKYIE